MAAWARAVRGLLLDISGVLYDSGGEGGGVPIAGSAEAVQRIKASGLKLRFCTNETQATREKFVKKLQGLGFDISVAEVTAPAPAACRLLKERGLRPHLLVHDDLVPEFADIDKTNPNCVVIGDAAENFSYANLNEAFRVLIGLEKPVLISLGKGRYYKETDGLKLDVGAYMKALEYACDVQAEVVGKPAKAFFESALAEMGVRPEQAIMIGDDIVSDVGGAQQCGMRAVQVRTGKYSSHPRDIACDNTCVLYVLSLGAGDCSLQQVRTWGVRIGHSTADLHLLVLWVLENSLASVGEKKKKKKISPSI
ncbi:phospholysine phosphohistidine inorganic pyrophosphate phosphatase isoform X1 [Phasianus colchicus]|uniref:phospholysine phosphohistidine inorganic pyrophosphate phosphatase isoform X1 n=1 Tax=Phasianus colchicus TaxID=9054 RepID=UPI00129E8BF6|nr:phospholysine phosphohistidine inorganic pyrophosphate phosphatase isoform X1 [Phasianus colchicus]